MREKTAKLAVSAAFLMLTFSFAPCLRAQQAEATVSGKVADSSGAAVANAMVSAKSLATGQSAVGQTDAAGTYRLEKLAPGEYEISVSSDGLATKTEKVTLEAGASLTFNAELATLPSAPQPQPQAPANNTPNATRGNQAPSLEDLGFSPAETKSNPREQALLDKRTRMLKIHQRLGLITTIPMIAALVTSNDAGETNGSQRTVHMILGAATADLYFTTAYFAIRAPRVPGTESRGPIRLHKALAWIHGPGMILTPILGALAYSQTKKGDDIHGIASAHGPVAIITAGAYTAALLSVTLKF